MKKEVRRKFTSLALQNIALGLSPFADGCYTQGPSISHYCYKSTQLRYQC